MRQGSGGGFDFTPPPPGESGGGGGEPDARGVAEEESGAVGDGRALLLHLAPVGGDGGGRGAGGAVPRRVRLRFVPELAVGVATLELRPVLLEGRVHGPVVLGDELDNLALAVHDEGEGRGLHSADGEEVPAPPVRRQGDEPP